MAWRLARSLTQLRVQLNTQFPTRSKAADGSIGDEAHASRASDHNPWVKDGTMGVVTAIDVTHDPKNGLDSEHLAEMLIRNRDPRLKYVISNRKIASFDHGWAWRPYNGKNAHNHHVHISVRSEKANYDNVKEWRLDNLVAPTNLPDVPHKDPHPLLKSGSKGAAVEELQTKLGLKVDGDFGPVTVEAVKKFQQAHGLTPDGQVGPYTWEKF